MIQNHKNHTCKALRSLGLHPDKTVYPILNELEKWLSHNGVEWTISRLKNLKVAYIQKLAGNKAFENISWIAHKGDSPSGPFKHIFELKNPQKALSALMVYSQYISDHATDKQLLKFVDSVVSPSTATRIPKAPACKLSLDKASKADDFYSRGVRVPYYTLSSNAEEAMEGKVVLRTVLQADTSLPLRKNNRTDEESANNDELLTKVRPRCKKEPAGSAPLLESWNHPFLQEMEHLTPEQVNVRNQGILTGSSEMGIHVGTIGLIQEPGFKLRCVANPLPAFQHALSGLSNSLYKTLKTFKADCTFSQEAGVTAIQEYLKSGKTLMSIDLSNATDRFPSDYTFGIIEKSIAATECSEKAKLHLLEALDLFKKLSKSSWKVNDQTETFIHKQIQRQKPGYENNVVSDEYGMGIKWSVGQPLGLQPSFAAFALSHHALALQTKPEFYRILGDDIVIDEKAGEQLLKLYSDIGVQISKDKTVTSNQLAEFGGKIIQPNRLLIQPKWKQMSDRNFIDFCKSLGPIAKAWARPRQQKIIRELEKIPASAHHFGLGQRDGRTFSERMETALPIIEKLESKEKLQTLSNDSVSVLEELKYSMEVETPYHNTRLDLSESISQEESPMAKARRAMLENRAKAKVQRNDLITDHRKAIDNENKSIHQMDELEARILRNSNVSSIDASEDITIPGWHNSSSGSISGDPRGTTTLDILEKKLTLKKGATKSGM